MMEYLCPKCSYKGRITTEIDVTKKCAITCKKCNYQLLWMDFAPLKKKKPIKTPPAALDVQIGGSHYKDYAIQPIEFFMANKLTYEVCATIKYVMRHQNKNGREDLEKAKHTIDIMIEHYYGGE